LWDDPAPRPLTTGFRPAYGIASLVAIMLYAAYGLLKVSGRVFLEAAPPQLEPDAIGQAMARETGVSQVHDLHDWELPRAFRRRTPGLRREEVAMLAAISPTYYAFLEQDRDVRPSRQVLDALARTLQLTAAERTHLHELHGGSAPDGVESTELLASAVSALVDRLDPCPTYVTGRRFMNPTISESAIASLPRSASGETPCE